MGKTSWAVSADSEVVVCTLVWVVMAYRLEAGAGGKPTEDHWAGIGEPLE